MTTTLSIPIRENTADDASVSTHGLRTGEMLDAATAAGIRRATALEGCKWDTQVGDLTTLAPFPLLLQRPVWEQLAAWSEQLTAESEQAAAEIAQRPELLRRLGLPRQLVKVLGGQPELTPAAGRVVRYDFHPTTEGWRISEANSDVPGGYTEASHFTALMAERYPQFPMAGDPAAEWTRVLAEAAGPGGTIALLSAGGYMEDHQINVFLANRLRALGCETHLAKPEQLRWQDGRAHLAATWHCGPVDALVRFYQAEWLARLPEASGWRNFFRSGLTPVANPPLAVITESKRFPLVWDELVTELPTWRKLLPETRAPEFSDVVGDDDWLLKTAMCNNGDTVSARRWMRPRDWWLTRLNVLLRPDRWAAQRRFESVPLDTPLGPRHVCVGVYTINGRAAGAYARFAEKPLVDFNAMDVALLLEDETWR